MKSKSAFFQMPKSDLTAIIVFFIVSIIAFFPFVTGAMWKGLTVNSWLLSLLALAIPIYNIVMAYLTNNDRYEE